MRWTGLDDTPVDPALGDLGYGPTTWDQPQFLVCGQTTTHERMPTAVLEPDGPALPLPVGPPLPLDDLELDDPLTGRSLAADTLIQRRMFADGLIVVHDGAVRFERYYNGFTETDRHLLHSVSKTLTTMMIGIAIDERRLDATAPIRTYLPELVSAAWDGVTLQNVLDMAVGIDTEEHYENADSMYWKYADHVGYYHRASPGLGVLPFVLEHLVRPDTPPGFRFNYASYLTNLLPICLERVYERPAVELYEERLFRRIGPEGEATLNCDVSGSPITEGQLALRLRDLARWAHLFLDDGRNLAGEQVVPAAWVHESMASSPDRRAAFERSETAELFPNGEYHNQVWLPDPQRGRAAMLGIHGQYALFDRARNLMVAGVSSYPQQVDALMTTAMFGLFEAIGRLVDPSGTTPD
jgi:CubicO group peptidase (beta-lactamase class C family)